MLKMSRTGDESGENWGKRVVFKIGNSNNTTYLLKNQPDY